MKQLHEINSEDFYNSFHTYMHPFGLFFGKFQSFRSGIEPRPHGPELLLFRWRGETWALGIKRVEAHANGRNKCQQLSTLLGVVGQQCWVRLHEPKSLTGFKLYATSANIVVVPCKRTQQGTTLLGPTMLGPFAWAFMLNRRMCSCPIYWFRWRTIYHFRNSTCPVPGNTKETII